MYYSWGDPADLRNPEKQGMNFFFYISVQKSMFIKRANYLHFIKSFLKYFT